MLGLWDGAVWQNVPALEVACFRPESSAHRPQTQGKLLYDKERIYGIFRVADRYVRCVHSVFQSEVYKDSCVEFFVQPPGAKGYFNFEFNCGGALLASYVTDPTKVAGRVSRFVALSKDDDILIQRYTSLPSLVEPEITESIIWFLEFSLPFAVLEKYAGLREETKGGIWQANFYKCGNDTSHPHWAAWSAVSELNFHLPQCFGNIIFGLIPKNGA